MRKILVLVTMIAFCLSFATPGIASTTLPISIKSDKATINLLKGNSTTKIDYIQFMEPQHTIVPGQMKELWNMNVVAYNTDGSTDRLEFESIDFTSSNNNVMTVNRYEVEGITVGTATLTATYNGYTATTTINVVQSEADVVIALPTNNGNQVKLNELQFATEFDYYDRLNVKSQYNAATGELAIYGIDWSLADSFFAYITQGNRLYKVVITQQHKGQTINVPFNEADYTQVTFNIPTSGAYTISDVALTDTQESVSAFFYNDYIQNQSGNFTLFIPKGSYAFQIIANEGTNFYSLTTGPLNFTDQYSVVSFSQQDIAKISFQSDIAGNAMIDSATICNFEYVQACSGAYSDNGTVNNLYANKNKYNFFGYSILVNDQWAYEFDKNNFELSSDQVIKIGNTLTAQFAFNRPSYQGGQKLFLRDEFKITDNYGNELYDIYNVNDNKQHSGTLTFTKGSEVYTVPLEGSLRYPKIVLPNAEGKFEVTYSPEGLSNSNPTIETGIKPNVSDTWKEWNNNRTVPQNHQWTVRFNSQLQTSSVNTNNIFIVDSEGYKVEGFTVRVDPSNATKVLITAPTAGYKIGQTYTLYIRNVQSIANKNLTSPIKQVFTVK